MYYHSSYQRRPVSRIDQRQKIWTSFPESSSRSKTRYAFLFPYLFYFILFYSGCLHEARSRKSIDQAPLIFWGRSAKIQHCMFVPWAPCFSNKYATWFPSLYIWEICASIKFENSSIFFHRSNGRNFIKPIIESLSQYEF